MKFLLHILEAIFLKQSIVLLWFINDTHDTGNLLEEKGSFIPPYILLLGRTKAIENGYVALHQLPQYIVLPLTLNCFACQYNHMKITIDLLRSMWPHTSITTTTDYTYTSRSLTRPPPTPTKIFQSTHFFSNANHRARILLTCRWIHIYVAGFLMQFLIEIKDCISFVQQGAHKQQNGTIGIPFVQLWYNCTTRFGIGNDKKYFVEWLTFRLACAANSSIIIMIIINRRRRTAQTSLKFSFKSGTSQS